MNGQVVYEVVGGKARYNGRTLAEWVPDVIDDLIAACDPLRIVLFGSLARGDDGPDSDIDIVVVLPKIDPATRHEVMTKLQLAVSAPVPVDIFPTDSREYDRRKDVVGSILYWPAREGRVVHERAA